MKLRQTLLFSAIGLGTAVAAIALWKAGTPRRIPEEVTAGADASNPAMPAIPGAIPNFGDESCSKKEEVKPCDTPAPEAMPDLRQWNGENGPKEPGTFIARSEAEWKELWAKTSKQSAPSVDFSKSMAAVVFGGDKPGSSLMILDAEERLDGKLIVHFRVVAPNPMLKKKLGNYPFAIRVLKKTDSAVEFAEE